METLLEAVSGITLLPYKFNLKKPPITSMKEFSSDSDLFDDYADYAAENKYPKQIVVFQRVISNLSLAQLKFDFPYFTQYNQKEKIWVNRWRLKNLLVSMISCIS